MKRRNAFKMVHFASTAWFTLSAGYILVWTLLQAGKSWWFIVSLSGYSALIAFLLVSLYLFAIFRGVVRSQKNQIEHPLTTCLYYSVFYDISPFLGTLAGTFGAIGVSRISHYLLVIATGSLWATFLVWIIIDPAAGLIEMLIPQSRKHRRERLAQTKTIRQQQHFAKQRLLAQVQSKEQLEQAGWNQALRPYAEKLAALVTGEVTGELEQAEAADIAVYAWQTGGLNCMRQLHSMAMEICRQKCQNATAIDYISNWWDGIGTWQDKWLNERVGCL
jgi:hypothetical protein